MRKKIQKVRCVKRNIPKCNEVCKTYDAVQHAYADVLASLDDVVEIRCNVVLDGLEGHVCYTSDFVCTKQNGDLMVRECVLRKYLLKPLTVKLLEMSRQYWETHGISDWGITVDAEQN